MKIKDNSIRIDFTPQLLIGLYQFDLISQIIADEQAVITSGSESTTRHSRTSLHYSGNAVDLRCRHLHPSEIKGIMDQFKIDMNEDFDLILEGHGTPNAHLHLEYQPKR